MDFHAAAEELLAAHPGSNLYFLLDHDPRVVYLGGNEKYWYAKLDMQNMVSDGDKMPV